MGGYFHNDLEDGVRQDHPTPPSIQGETSELVKRLSELLAKATSPNDFSWYFPWQVVPYNGKPIIAGAKSGNLFQGFIGTWDDADLIVETLNALPTLLAAIERLQALSPSVEKQEWRDIASAPKDGTHIDLWCNVYGEGWRLTDCYWDNVRDNWYVPARLQTVPYPPQFWMPEPEPPATAIESRAYRGDE